MAGGAPQSANNAPSRVLMATRRLRRQPALGLSIAVALYGVALAARLALGHFGMTSPLPFATFAPAILVASLVGGVRAGVLVVALSGLTTWYFFLPPAHSFALEGTRGVVLAAYVVSSLILIGIVHLLDVEFERLIRERERSEHLFQELQHRIANNLQTVSAILRLQERDVIDAESGRAALRDACARLATMGAMHRRMYDPGSQEVDLGDRLKSVCADIFAAAAPANVDWRVEAPDGVVLSGATALTLSLIVNETVTNAIKYAFPGGAPGRIVVSFAQDQGDYVLSVADDGVGLGDRNVDDGRLGVRIVKSLAMQLGGKPEWKSGAGTIFTLRFSQ